MAIDRKEAHPLAWPAEWPRTRLQDRKKGTSWSKDGNYYRSMIEEELRKMQCPGFVISSDVPLTQRNLLQRGMDPLDVGVAVYFSRPPREGFAWQDALDLHMPAPTKEQISQAFRRAAMPYHPDNGGDAVVFAKYVMHRDHALRYVERKSGDKFDYVIACDQFKEVRWNMAAIGFTLKAIRQIERCGATGMLERAFKGFAALTAGEAAAV